MAWRLFGKGRATPQVRNQPRAPARTARARPPVAPGVRLGSVVVWGAGRASVGAAPARAREVSAPTASRGARARVSRSLLCGRGCAADWLVLRPVQRPVLLGAVPHGATRGTEIVLLHGRLPLVARCQGAMLQAVFRHVRAPPRFVALHRFFYLL